MKACLIPGFIYDCEIVDRHGRVVDQFSEHNIIPIQGMNRIASLLLGGGATPTANWYIGLLNTGFTVNENSTLQGAAGAENTGYTTTGNARLDWDFTYDNKYVVTNLANRAEFTFDNATTIYGAFLTELATRGTYAAGCLLSVANFTTPRAIDAGGTLRVTAGITLGTS